MSAYTVNAMTPRRPGNGRSSHRAAITRFDAHSSSVSVVPNGPAGPPSANRDIADMPLMLISDNATMTRMIFPDGCEFWNSVIHS